VLEGGRSPAGQARRAVYRRRRLAALAILVAVVAVALLLASAVLARVAGDGTPDPVAGSSAPAEVHVVQPGDTLWSIARSLEPEGDVRLLVDRLVDLNGGAPITVGQQLVLP
jgi:LysM repeat protein